MEQIRLQRFPHRKIEVRKTVMKRIKNTIHRVTRVGLRMLSVTGVAVQDIQITKAIYHALQDEN